MNQNVIGQCLKVLAIPLNFPMTVMLVTLWQKPKNMILFLMDLIMPEMDGFESAQTDC